MGGESKRNGWRLPDVIVSAVVAMCVAVVRWNANQTVETIRDVEAIRTDVGWLRQALEEATSTGDENDLRLDALEKGTTTPLR